MSDGWPSLAEFCADCPCQAGCPLSTVVEVESCVYVQIQTRSDRHRPHPLLRRKPYEATGTIRQPYTAIDPEDAAHHSQAVSQQERRRIEARVAWVRENH